MAADGRTGARGARRRLSEGDALLPLHGAHSAARAVSTLFCLCMYVTVAWCTSALVQPSFMASDQFRQKQELLFFYLFFYTEQRVARQIDVRPTYLYTIWLER